ncbi:MAG: ribosome-binding factor A [Candidatus Nealsonbacteria bacterium CG_4_10_14_0_8_um_filter_35_10]|uniref:Ribosome-binding factor A n=2 Tax=Candidatus Nealsoniibacteriota TaxID=1817911 RepID=A0A2M7R8S7_9BACT|nr:MAG: ribosome-binding factor A [Parcubacteria group bacterium CG1_02_36_42]PIY90953.1 MAG: ribosome-binding factor A [Candidatus Nealsonbacteria bacterium CG_4_10_14_0_8_um_filter_35_10]PJB99286.1 MAG: ribosome-binding factor A [Candidatus Nealsonbacteria bacterium CG_4_9_14_0_8_um_filter_35_12]
MSKRISRLNQLLKEELGKILLREGNFPKGILVTITQVETLANLTEAKVWVSVLPGDKAEKIVGNLNKRIYFLQQKINKILRMRIVPKIRFQIETKTKEAARVEELLEKIRKSD